MSTALGAPAAASGNSGSSVLKAKQLAKAIKAKRTNMRGTGSAANLRGDGGNGP